MSARDIDPDAFRELLGRFATGVSVVTVLADGHPAGMTASSLSSVSLHPPLLSVCIGHAATLHAALLVAPVFAVNILSDTQEEASRRFAGEHPDRFDGVGYHLSAGGLVLLDQAHAWIECERQALVEAGDHTVIIARVTGGAPGAGATRPLLYYRGGYAELG